MKAKEDELSSSEGDAFTENTNKTTDMLILIAEERRRLADKWGRQIHSIDRWLVILGEEYGEVCRAAFHYKGDTTKLKRELIHVAAVAVAIAEGM